MIVLPNHIRPALVSRRYRCPCIDARSDNLTHTPTGWGSFYHCPHPASHAVRPYLVSRKCPPKWGRTS
jgi:hypothetical protein